MSEFINNVTKRKEALKEVIRRLHAGETVEDLKKQFGDVIEGATAADIADAERAMIKEGVSVREIQRLCDLHVAVFRDSLNEEPAPESLPGHPVFNYRMENEIIQRLLEAMAESINAWDDQQAGALAALRKQAQNLKSIEKHYLRKENLLFPYLEKKGFEGPSAVMWGVHNEIRSKIKQFLTTLRAENPEQAEAAQQFVPLARDITEMIYKEERILFPAALGRLTAEEWQAIQAQEEEIGYFEAPPSEDRSTEAQTENATPTQSDEENIELMDNTNKISLDTGLLTEQQINLMLTHLPIDITFVDENDEVRYFSQGKDRIFHRSPAIIGRSVTNCHPPQSVHRVEIILDDFKAGKRDLAEFWIQMENAFVHIRYFAMRDEDGKYLGCIEVSQEISHIRALEGEKRLLDDAPGYDE